MEISEMTCIEKSEISHIFDNTTQENTPFRVILSLDLQNVLQSKKKY